MTALTEKERFTQRIFLSHIDASKPVVCFTEGYGMHSNRTRELSKILGANQVIIEHRYFGQSRPSSSEWKYLTINQAAADHHRIIQFLKRLYPGKWVSSGKSKGGQTALFHRRFYPKDVSATVVYVAPVNTALEDPRIDRFIKANGDENCREKIELFQIMVLKNREKILHLLEQYAKKKDYHFSIGFDVTLEYAVLEYPFTFWQWGSSSYSSIPKAGASASELFAHLTKVISFNSYYSDKAIKDLEPAFYQFCTELGYYGFNYNSPRVKRLLKTIANPSNTFFAPKDTPLKFKPQVMEDILSWLQREGNKIIYIYGELDPWSASAVNVNGNTNALKIVKEGASHEVSIKDLSSAEKKLLFSALKKWLELEVPQ